MVTPEQILAQEIARLKAENKNLETINKAAGSLLLDVQQDCIRYRKALQKIETETGKAAIPHPIQLHRCQIIVQNALKEPQ